MDNITLVKQQIRLKEWATQVADCQSSGLTVEEWCRQHNMNVKTYYYRLRTVRKHALDNVPKDMLPDAEEEDLVVFKKLEVKAPEIKTTAPIVIHLKDSIVEVPSGMSSETLEAVLLALKKYAG